MSQGPSLVTQDTPIGNPGPFQAGGQAPPIHWVTVSQQGEFNGIPGQERLELLSIPLVQELLAVLDKASGKPNLTFRTVQNGRKLFKIVKNKKSK